MSALIPWSPDASWKKYRRPVGRCLKRSSRSDQTGDHSISAEGSKRRNPSPEDDARLWPCSCCASLNSRTSLGKDRVARQEIREPAGRSDLVALEYPAIALDGVHQGARFALFRGTPLAVAVTDQAGLRR